MLTELRRSSRRTTLATVAAGALLLLSPRRAHASSSHYHNATMSSVAAASGLAQMSSAPMRVTAVRRGQVTHPTGDKSFAVMQAFPAAVSVEEADPFLMCDHFGPTLSKGRESDPDSFPVAWHPHIGMDIATVLVSGRGRHADSLGNREEFQAPGLQWVSVGSGIEHAEAGGTPAGEQMEGFQIWINVPSARKLDDPRYGTVPATALPVVDLDGGASARLIAGPLLGHTGPFTTVQPVFMADVTLPEGASATVLVPSHMETAMVYAYKGTCTVSGTTQLTMHHIALLDAADAAGPRGIALVGGKGGGAVMLFCGRRLNQPVAWHGPFVMTTQAEIKKVISDYQRGLFPPVRAPFDYRRLSAFPADHPARGGGGGKK